MTGELVSRQTRLRASGPWEMGLRSGGAQSHFVVSHIIPATPQT